MDLDFLLLPYFDKIEKRLVRIEDMLSKSRSVNIDPPLSKKQAAKFLCISVQTLDRRLKSGDIPPKFIHGKGKVKNFFASELESYIRRS